MRCGWGGLGLSVAALLGWGWLTVTEGAAPLSNTGAALTEVVAGARDQNLDLGQRLQSIGVLRKWASPEVRGPLMELLKDPAPEIRAAAAKGLGWPGNTPAVMGLAERVADKREQGAVRAAAIEALVKIGDKAVREQIVEASRDADSEIREAALRGLIDGPLQSGADRRVLATRAAEDGDLSLPFRADAIKALTATGDPAAIPTLVKLLETGPRAKIGPPPPGATQQQILGVRYLQIGDLRAWAVQGLGELGDQSVLPQVIKATEDTEDFFLRYIAAGVLVNWKAPGGLPVLLRLMGDPVSDVRTVAVVGVGRLGDATNVAAVAGRLKDGVQSVRLGAVEALATIGGAAARERMQAALATERDPQVRQALEAALTQLKR
jgi:HEAT repeat protein